MENRHRERIRKKFKRRPADSRIVALNIPDEHERNNPALIELLEKRVGPVISRFLAEM
jgi:predicted protein tyrosine phosphatase